MYLNDSSRDVPGSLTEKLHSCIAEMLDTAVRLRKAIASRDVQAIWETLAAKEEQAAQLEEYTHLWQQLYGDSPTAAQNVDSQRQQIHQDLQRLQLTEQANASLARTYLGAIRKAFDAASPGMAQKTNMYTRRGRIGTKNASLLVKRIG